MARRPNIRARALPKFRPTLRVNHGLASGAVMNNLMIPREAGGGSVPEQLGAAIALDFIGANASNDIIEGATNVNVAGWQDRSGNDNDPEQLTPVEQLVFTQPNGPVTFATPQNLTGLPQVTAGDYTWVIKFKAAGGLTKTFIGGNGTEWIFLHPSGLINFRTSAAIERSFTFASPPINGQYSTMFLVRTGTSYRCYLESTESTTGAIVDTGNFDTLVNIGRRTGAGQNFLGDMDGFYQFPSALDSSERGQMQTYIDGL